MKNIQSVKQRFGIIGRSPKLDHALDTAIRVSGTDLTVMITGESGVGKENFSKIIHALSPRKHNPIIAVNCGAIPKGTINSELFGHEKGAFTGASNERKGYFETVNGGTIFLDEIAEMPLDTQAYLLRILESGEFIRVGSSKVLKTDVRIIAATNVELMAKVREGKFREDLFYRLNTVPIEVPPLRERREDIYMLFRRFAVDFGDRYQTSPIQLTPEARRLLENYSWPGNIRELKNVAEQLSVLSEDREIDFNTVLRFFPKINTRNLPAIRRGSENEFQEREILYKLLFDMKNDLNDLKSVVKELIKINNLEVPEQTALQAHTFGNDLEEEKNGTRFPQISSKKVNDFGLETEDENVHQPIIIDQHRQDNYTNSEVVEENLSLEDMEKDFIKKALKKHKGRRKDAAEDLGISERTLYRKIKQYDL